LKNTLYIAVLAYTMHEYKAFVPRDIIPGLEKYHGIKFKLTPGGRYEAPLFVILPALCLDDVMGLRNYQIVKVGQYYKNEEALEIVKHWEENRK